eukprot:TRINITY_DN493_c5_g1_i5.p1 TRINITY_DN493_c5_g1~~TRINITY_DN493_c5_g1_i5.p1  ORF type:complete len:170 (-),score=71.46 TRINITY_DN493_c5_g1_i5:285-794(-)
MNIVPNQGTNDLSKLVDDLDFDYIEDVYNINEEEKQEKTQEGDYNEDNTIDIEEEKIEEEEEEEEEFKPKKTKPKNATIVFKNSEALNNPRYQAKTLNILETVNGNNQGVKYEQDGRWFFRALDNLPPPIPYKHLEKNYISGKSTFIDWNARGNALDKILLEEDENLVF